MSRRRVQVLVCLLAMVALGGGLWHFLRGPAPMTYDGKTSREWALQILSSDAGNREQASAAFRRMGPQVVPELMALLQTKDSLFRKPVWVVAERLPPRQRRNVLANTGRTEAAALRRGAARAVGILGPQAEPAIPILARLLRAPEYELRWEASAALGKIGKAAVPELVKAVNDSNFEIKEPGIAALGQIGPEAQSSIPALRSALDFEHPVVRTMAAYSLADIGAPALPTLLEAAENGSDTARGAARQGLEKAENRLRISRSELIQMARDQRPEFRQCALKLLGRIRAGDADAIAAMTNALNDAALPVRLATLEALGRVPRKAATAVPQLIGCLEDGSPEVREQAAMTLGKIGAPAQPAAGRLRVLAEDRDEKVRAAAKEALAKITPAQPLSQK